MTLTTRRLRALTAASVLLLSVPAARAIQFDVPTGTGTPIHGVLNSTFTAGVQVRVDPQSDKLIGKSNLNPAVCGAGGNTPNGSLQSCQGLFRDQIYPSQALAAAPGAPSNNGDQGDLDYNRWGITQSPLKFTEDLSLTWGNYGFFGRALYFYDLTNDNFTEFHPNEITPQNVNQVGRVGPILPAGPAAGLLSSTLGVLPTIGELGVVRSYGPGGVVRSKRSDPNTLHQIGAAAQFLDSYVFGKFNVLSKPVTVKLGRQTVSWGESTTLVLNSINSVNPVNANNFYRVGNQVEEDFTPVNMLFVSADPFANATLEGFYELEFQNTQAPAPGSFFSDTNIGTNNAVNNVNTAFGGNASDPDCVAHIQDNPLAGITHTCLTIGRLGDESPRRWGQFGLSFQYYAENIGTGTQFGLYYEHYHSRLPMASFFATQPSCARREGNSLGLDATNLAEFLLDCPNLPLTSSNPGGPGVDDALPLDTAKLMLEYPEDIDLYGMSFNSTVGNYSIQGEAAFRPNKPMQIDYHDLGFAAFGPTLTRCGNVQLNGQPLVCSGEIALGGIGGFGNTRGGGVQTYNSSNFLNAKGQNAFADTFDLLIGNIDGSARSFPNFVVPYRHGTLGENTPCYAEGDPRFHAYNRQSPCYIRGYERFGDLNFDFGATRVYGATENWIHASQVVMLYEFGAEFVPDMPALDELVLQGPGQNYYGPTAGADGSGANGSRRACSTNVTCVSGTDGQVPAGADGLRFNPHQQDPAGYPTRFSYGYRIISLIKYESFLPGFSEQPFIYFAQDIGGTSPGPAGNFVKGRKQFSAQLETRYKSAISFTVGYTVYWGGGAYNTLEDRDNLVAFLKYQF